MLSDATFHTALIISLAIGCMIGFVTRFRVKARLRKAAMALEQERNLVRIKEEIQEQAFQQISAEIHDNINLNLSFVKLQLNTIDHDNRDDVEVKVRSSVELLTKSIHELVNLSKVLDADFIRQQGLITAVERQLEWLKASTKLQVHIDFTGSPVYLQEDKDLVIFRIIQESLNNIVKHAKAKQVALVFDYRPHELWVDIKDDGAGFDKEDDTTKKGSGLNNMQNRAALLSGQFVLKSHPGRGTHIHLSIPYTNGR